MPGCEVEWKGHFMTFIVHILARNDCELTEGLRGHLVIFAEVNMHLIACNPRHITLFFYGDYSILWEK